MPHITSLDSLPTEILDVILTDLDQETYHSALLSCKSLGEAAAAALYRYPIFASTYHFAQFVTTISHSKCYASMVRVVDLSFFNHRNMSNLLLAGWREWKARTDPFYSLTDKAPTPSWKRDTGPPPYSVNDPAKHRPSHPMPHRFLKRLGTPWDVPVGRVLHVLKACRNIRVIDLSTVTFAEDYSIPPFPASKYSIIEDTQLLFISDTPKTWTWDFKQGIVLVTTHDIAQSIATHPCLEKLTITGTVWLTTADVTTIIAQSRSLQMADFRGSGMGHGMPWAVESVPELLASIIAACESKVPRGNELIEEASSCVMTAE